MVLIEFAGSSFICLTRGRAETTLLSPISQSNPWKTEMMQNEIGERNLNLINQFKKDPIFFFMNNDIVMSKNVLPGPGTFKLTGEKGQKVRLDYLQSEPVSSGIDACYISCVRNGSAPCQLDNSSSYMFTDFFQGGQLLAYGHSSHQLTVEYSTFSDDPKRYDLRVRKIDRRDYPFFFMFRPGYEYVPEQGALLIGTYDCNNGWFFWARKRLEGKEDRLDGPLLPMSPQYRRRSARRKKHN